MSVTPFDNSTSTPPGDDKPALKPIDKLRASVRTKVMATTGVDQSGASATERKKKRRMSQLQSLSRPDRTFDDETLRQVFRQVDDDGSGSVTVEELADGMGVMGLGGTLTAMSAMLEEIDEDQSGSISEKEFCAYFKGKKMRDVELKLIELAASAVIELRAVHYGRLANELCERTHEGGAAGDLDGFLAPAGPSNPLVDDRGKAVAGYTEPRLWYQMSGFDDDVLRAIARRHGQDEDKVCLAGAFQQPVVRPGNDKCGLQMVLHKIELESGPLEVPELTGHETVRRKKQVLAAQTTAPLKNCAQLAKKPPKMRIHQLAVVLLDDHTVLSIGQSHGEDSKSCKEVDGIMDELRDGLEDLRENTAGFLAVSLLEAVVDSNILIRHALTDWKDKTEEAIMTFAAKRHSLHLYHFTKISTRFLEYVEPVKRDVEAVLKDEPALAAPDVQSMLDDILDDIGTLDTEVRAMGESINVLRSLYEAMAADRMNQILFILTLLTVMFIPAQFLTGLYGMNFDTEQEGNLPELGYAHAYSVWWGVVIVMSGSLFYFMATKLQAFELYR